MKKYLIIILIFFLFFIKDFRRADAAIDLTKCNIYVDGVCQSGYYYGPPVTEETTVNVTENLNQNQAAGNEAISIYFNLVFQFFGICILLIILIILLESVLETR